MWKKPKSVIELTKSLLVDEFNTDTKDYITLANKLGVNPKITVRAQLTKCIHDNHIQVYDVAKVFYYLDALRKQDQKVHWCPVREQDLFRYQSGTVLNAYFEFDGLSMLIPSEVYSKPIPHPVLLTMDKIATEVPGALFYISDIHEVKDPFLMVTGDHTSWWYIVERWDEPTFRG